MEPLILTARLDPEAQVHFNQLRQQHFPPERNYLEAHLTLFHALPQENRTAIVSNLQDITRCEPLIEATASKLQSLGRGVAFLIHSPGLATLRASLANLWHLNLTPQDRQTPRLHITIQNKVTPDAAKALLNTLAKDFQPRPLTIEGLDLWRYQNGPWSLLESFSFEPSNRQFDLLSEAAPDRWRQWVPPT